MRFFILVTLLALSAANSASFDTIGLKDGAEIEGVTANSQAMRSGRLYGTIVSILAGGELLRIRVGDIDYLIIGTGEHMLAIDPSQKGMVAAPHEEWSGSFASPVDASSRRKEIIGQRNLGAVLTIVGVAATAAGLLIKMGEEELKISQDSDKIENTYNTTNYLLMGGGALLTVAGVAITVIAESDMRELEREMGVSVSFVF